MTGTVYCFACGAGRTLVPGRHYESGPFRDSYLMCLRCGSDAFTPRRQDAPVFPEGFLLTTEDVHWLRFVRISPEVAIAC